MTDPPVVGLIGTGAGGVEHLRTRLVVPLMAEGCRVAVTLTPTAADWLRGSGESDRVEEVTGLPVRHHPRLPGEVSPHPRVACYCVCPATANSVAKIASGIADNLAMTAVCEALGLGVPVVVFPRINAAHARHPAWSGHITSLRNAGVDLVHGQDVWPLHEPGSAPPGRELPWDAVRVRVLAALRR